MHQGKRFFGALAVGLILTIVAGHPPAPRPATVPARAPDGPAAPGQSFVLASRPTPTPRTVREDRLRDVAESEPAAVTTPAEPSYSWYQPFSVAIPFDLPKESTQPAIGFSSSLLPVPTFGSNPSVIAPFSPPAGGFTRPELPLGPLPVSSAAVTPNLPLRTSVTSAPLPTLTVPTTTVARANPVAAFTPTPTVPPAVVTRPLSLAVTASAPVFASRAAVTAADPVRVYAPLIVATDNGANGQPLSPAFVVNNYLGATTFYNAGITGQNAIAANVEGSHIANTHEGLTQVTVFVTGAGAVNQVDDHPTAAGMVIGWRNGADLNNRGIAYNAALWSGAISTSVGGGGFSTTYQSQLTVYRPMLVTGVGGQTVDVINSSWGDPSTSIDPTGSAHGDTSRYIDALITTTAGGASAKTVVFAAGNAGPGVNTVGSPAAGYNIISVGSLGKSTDPVPYDTISSFSSRSPNDFFIPNVNQPSSLAQGTVVPGVRAKVDITAPGEQLYLATQVTTFSNAYARTQGTSFAAPTVAGGATLLVSLARTNNFTNLNEAIDARVIKAVLLNSADKPTGWSNGQTFNGSTWSTSQGLDYTYGAGRMNLDQAFQQFNQGTITAGIPGNTITPITTTGWDRGRVTQGTPNDYSMPTTLAAGSSLNVTLDWFVDRFINNTGSSVGGVAPDGTTEVAFHDLRVEVWARNPFSGAIIGTAPVALSDSRYNNTEHLSFLIPKDGSYLIRVSQPSGSAGVVWDFGTPGGTGPTNFTDYGLAWLSRSNLIVPSGTQTVSTSVTQSDGLIAGQPASGSTASVTVTGSGVAVNFANKLYLGGNDLSSIGQAPIGGYASLTVSGGATVTVDNEARVFPGSSVTANGGTFAAGRLTVDAGGTVAFFGVNRFPVNQLVNSGTVTLDQTTSGNAITSALTLNAGSKFLTAGLTTPSTTGVTFSSAATVTLAGGGDVTFGGDAGLYLNAPLTGSGNLVKTGSPLTSSIPEMYLFAASNYTGATTVGPGRAVPSDTNRLVLSAAGTVGNPSSTQPVTVNANGTLRLDNASNGFTPNRLPPNAPVVLNGGRLVFAASSSAASQDTAGPITVNGFGVISGESGGSSAGLAFGNLTRVNNATIVFRTIPNGDTLGGPPGAGTVNFTFGNTVTAFATVGENTPGGTKTGVVPFAVWSLGFSNTTNPSGLVTYDANGVRTLSATDSTVFNQVTGTSSGLNTFASQQNNNLILDQSAGNTYSIGTSTVNVNSLVSNGGTFAQPTITGSGTFNVESGAIAPSLGLRFNGPTLDFGTVTGYFHVGNSGSFDVQIISTSKITGSGGVVVSSIDTTGNGLVFSNSVANPFTGGLFVLGAARVDFSRDDQLGAAGGGVTLDGGTLRYLAAASVALANRPVMVGVSGGTVTTNLAAGTLTLSGAVTGPGDLIKTGPGTLALTNPANAYQGATQIQAGTLSTNVAGVFPTMTTLVLGTPGTATTARVSLANASQTVAGLAVAAGNTNPGGNTIDSPVGTGASTLTVNATTDSTFGGTFTNNLIVVKNGPGTLTLTGASTHTGGTTVSGGALVVSGSIPSVTVNSGGTLGGTGTVTGAATVNGTVNPGDPGRIGTLSLGPAVFNSGGKLTVQVNTAPGSGTAGVNWDKVAVAGSLTGSASGGTFTIDFQAAGVVNGFDNTITQTWPVATFGSTTLTAAAFAVNPVGWTGLNGATGGVFQAVMNANGGELDVVYSPVPEPGLVVVVAAAGLAAGRRRRAARRRAA
jgi:autotransporter-associated beta strand protein